MHLAACHTGFITVRNIPLGGLHLIGRRRRKVFIISHTPLTHFLKVIQEVQIAMPRTSHTIPEGKKISLYQRKLVRKEDSQES